MTIKEFYGGAPILASVSTITNNDDVVIGNGTTLVMDTNLEMNSLWVGYDASGLMSNINVTPQTTNHDSGFITTSGEVLRTISVWGYNGVGDAGRVFVSSLGSVDNAQFGGLRIEKIAGSSGITLLYRDYSVDRALGFIGETIRLDNMDEPSLYNPSFLGSKDSRTLVNAENIDVMRTFNNTITPIKGGLRSSVRPDALTSRILTILGVFETVEEELLYPSLIRELVKYQLNNPSAVYRLLTPSEQYNVKIEGFANPERGGKPYVEYTIILVEV